jgi:3-dehydroquinate synthase
MEIPVNLGPRSYPVVLRNNNHADFPGELTTRFAFNKFAIVTNATIATLYKDVISLWEKALNCSTFIIPDGEKYKTIETWNNVVDFLLQSGLDRKSVVCALGGGVVGDITGFAASACLRGIACVQIPTTLLSMVDSSVGGKTGVDHPLGKNLIGAFHQPSLVWLDTAFLDTLPHREFIAGYAELYKYAFIGGKEMFDFVLTNHNAMISKNTTQLLEGIQRSVQIKAAVVEKDELETLGLRAFLNFGHTFAHALERVFNFQSVLHGEAVLFGIKCSCKLGVRLGTIPMNQQAAYATILSKCPHVPLPEKPAIRAEALYEAMFTDKKTIGGEITFVVPATMGTSVLRNDVSREIVVGVVDEVLRES